MRLNRLLLTATACLFIANKAQASSIIDTCEQNSKTKIAYSLCLEKESQKLERELELWNNNHIYRLEEQTKKTGRTSSLKLFKRAQDDFIMYRESNCRWYYLSDTPNPTASNEYKKCMIKLTQFRVSELSEIKSNED